MNECLVIQPIGIKRLSSESETNPRDLVQSRVSELLSDMNRFKEKLFDFVPISGILSLITPLSWPW